MKNHKYYWVYILRVSNGNLYTGYSNNLTKRYYQHITGLSGSKYIKSFQSEKLEQCWRIYDKRGIAMKIESFIKTKTRKEKINIINKPSELKDMLYNKFNISYNIYIFNPKLIENKLKKDKDHIFLKEDPFFDIPEGDT